MILPQFRLHFNTNINFFVILQKKKNFGISNKNSQKYPHIKKALTSSGIIFHGRRSSFLSNDVPLHRHFRLPLPYPFSDTTVYAKSGRNCVKGGEPP